jgi:DNA polymerase-3 subunit epsilon
MQTDRVLRRGDPPPTDGAPVQLGLDELGTPLSEVTFVVVDLETTGGSPTGAAITEIGAVKVRGGEVLGEFQTLVDPGMPVPAFISTLTGITTSMVAGAPRIGQVLPSFLEWAHGAVLVAHNAPFDIGFLKAAARSLDYPWPGAQVLDTVALARRAVTREEVPNHKLATLAALFHTSTSPSHRALADARATVDVLHALLGRLAPLGITHLEDLASATDPVPASRRRKRHLADGLPDQPGVYLFKDARGEVLYVGTSVNIRTRVRSYFTRAEQRAKINEMVGFAEVVTPVVCGTVLESRVRELRLIAEHDPRYNRRSRRPERMPWVRLTVEPFPRLSVVREVRSDGPDGAAAHIGPFGSTAAAQAAIEALHEAFPIRQCRARLPLLPAVSRAACVLADIGSCGAPCTGSQDRREYAEIVAAVRSAMVEDARPVVRALAERITTLAAQQRYEDAAAVRDRLSAFLRGAARAQRYRPMASCPELIAARRTGDGGWEIVVIRHGRLAATTTVSPGADPALSIEALRACAEQVPTPVPPALAAHPEEADLLLAWLDSPGVRLVSINGAAGWCCPVRGAQAHLDLVSTAELVQQRADWQGALQVVGQGALQVVGAAPA